MIIVQNPVVIARILEQLVAVAGADDRFGKADLLAERDVVLSLLVKEETVEGEDARTNAGKVMPVSASEVERVIFCLESVRAVAARDGCDRHKLGATRSVSLA